MVGLGTALDAQVESIVKRTGVTRAEVVRHAMRLYLPLEAAASQGATILIVHADGVTAQVEPLSIFGIPPKTPDAPALVMPPADPPQ